MNLIVDAGVAIRWFVAAPGWEAARALKAPGVQFFAPELVLADMAVLVDRLVAANLLGQEEASLIMHTAPRAFARLFPIMLLRDRALALALERDLDVNGCFYLALAEWESVPLVSDDPALIAASESLADIEIRALAG